MTPLELTPMRLPVQSRARVIGIASAIWAGSIFLSRIMGLVREQIIGRTLGASREADLYFASFTLPDFLNYLLLPGMRPLVILTRATAVCVVGVGIYFGVARLLRVR